MDKNPSILICLTGTVSLPKQKAFSTCNLDSLNLSSPIRIKNQVDLARVPPRQWVWGFSYKDGGGCSRMEDPGGKNACYQCLLPKQRIFLPRIAPVEISWVRGRSLYSHKASILAKPIYSSLILCVLSYVPVVVKHSPLGALPHWKISSW